ncbi:MAG TPA: IS200/IS605 family transposase [Armatimonadota bacterium]|jgi:REP element-mobilizing transposase RayT
MANSFISCYVHVVFSTYRRQPSIEESWRERLWAYIGGVLESANMVPICVGGTEDHCHALIAIPGTLALSHAVQLLKGGSSHWIRQNIPSAEGFAWQEGYGAFSVSPNARNTVIAYIRGQEEHHKLRSFQDEYLRPLVDSGVEFDERYVWG